MPASAPAYLVTQSQSGDTFLIHNSMNRVITLTEHILHEERMTPGASGSLTIVLNQIAEAGKNIASHVKRSGLADIIGQTGNTNAFDEQVQKLDEYSNELLIDMLEQTGEVSIIASEELENPMYLKNNGKYMVYMDPLDGSSNIDVNVSIGTIFSIYHASEGLLQKGEAQVAAGYILYGSSVMFVYTCANTVNGFTLDPAIGSFLLSHPNIKIPHTKHEYSINEANVALYSDDIQSYLLSLKKDAKYKARYIGSMVADIHRILIRGGIFLYPQDHKHPHGKLRLMHEVNAMARLVEVAAGRALSEGHASPLSLTPTDIHQRVSIVVGSAGEVEKYAQMVKNE